MEVSIVMGVPVLIHFMFGIFHGVRGFPNTYGVPVNSDKQFSAPQRFAWECGAKHLATSGEKESETWG